MYLSFEPAATSSRRVIDIAVGVLIGMRGCTEAQAFAEIAAVVRRTGTSLSDVAAGLVDIAAGRSSASAQQWAELFTDAPRPPLHSVG